MQCSYCGSDVKEGAKFCRECGKEIIVKTEALNSSLCSACGNVLDEGAAFCNECGHKVSNESNETENVSCPKCGKQLSENALFCGECGTTLASKITRTQKNVQSPKKKRDGGLIVLIVILIVVLLGSGGTVFWIYHTNPNIDIDSPNILSESSSNSIDIKETDTTTDEEETDKSNDVTANINNNTDEFSYTFNQENITESPTYTRIENSEYSYYCAVPKHFIEDVAGKVYRAPDNTALMDIRSKSNTSNMTVEQAMNEYISEIDGTVTYSASGDTWFAVSIEKDGIAYYMKGFVDHYIREFTFSFPTKYLDVYDVYINYIEDNFKRTDV